MPPKGTKKSAASKGGANLKNQAAPKKQSMTQMSIEKDPEPTHDANGFLLGSKEANWALLQASNAWYTDLFEQDLEEAEKEGVQLGSNKWIQMKTPQLAPPVLENTRLLSRVEWDFPDPKLVSPEPQDPPRRSTKRKAGDDEVAAPAAKRSRRGATDATSAEGGGGDDEDTPADILALLALPPSRQESISGLEDLEI
ncbi:hypothetical protein FKW77_009710 [Venturia effusa]|uniref:Uncharacterized protein n=1 Tax=Venturia effusa TaxID=50376 RepID=A0A517LEP0_9PEZI|nr:hypothetical protein FKW77_009710 [Venturia effusa]